MTALARCWRLWVRQRPLIVAVAVCGLALMLPRVGEEVTHVPAGTTSPAGRELPGDAADPDVWSGDGLSDAGGPTADVAGPGPGSGGDPAAPEPGSQPTSPADPTFADRYPGINSPEALANPACDQDRGRIRFPSQYAPPCVAPWPENADNGGATAKGVTGESIRLVVYLNPDDPSTGPSKADIKTQVLDTINAFADHYELWGRELDIVFHEYTGTDETAQRADATRVANELEPFLATSFLQIGFSPPRVWATELAARGVISWDEYATYDELQAQAGYRWAYNPDDLYSALAVAEYVGKRLAGRPARWAGEVTMHDETRVFGLAYDDAWDRSMFERTLERFGGELADAVSYRDGTLQSELQQRATTQVARLKSKGVNNVILVGGVFYTAAMTRAATQQNYFPEWTISGWNLQDVAVLSRIGPDQRQWANAFGIGLVPPLESPIEISERNQIHQWAHGRQPIAEAVNGQAYLFAKSVIAGLHLAGPNLTPETFRDAMFQMTPSGGRWCDCVTRNGMSFGRNIDAYPADKYFDIDDFAEKWWDPDTRSEDEVGLVSNGAYWVVADGERYAPGDFPSTEPDVFNRDNARISYSEVPPTDRPPDYPPPGS